MMAQNPPITRARGGRTIAPAQPDAGPRSPRRPVPASRLVVPVAGAGLAQRTGHLAQRVRSRLRAHPRPVRLLGLCTLVADLPARGLELIAALKRESYGRRMGRWGAEVGVVQLPDGRVVRGTGTRRSRGQAPPPEFAVYLLSRAPHCIPWPHRWVRWPDFCLPASTEDALDALQQAHTRSVSDRVEIACGGGIGRTGTALAVLAIMSGLPADAAVDWVRANYHRRAVETRRQRAWITTAC